MHPEFIAIYEDIQRKIQKEILNCKDRLSETSLMKEYGCSRALIRTVISWCDFNGILKVVPKSGTFVVEETQKSFREKVEVRSYLEKLACRLLIERITTRELASLYELVDIMSEKLNTVPYSPHDFSKVHYQFHYTLVVLANNDHLRMAFLNLNLRYSYLFAEGSDTDVRVLIQSNTEHKNILDCIKDKDIPQCEKAIDEHLWLLKDIPASLAKR